ncbi:MAG: TonB-dependent receptor [Pseudomonadota bacterium]
MPAHGFQLRFAMLLPIFLAVTTAAAGAKLAGRSVADVLDEFRGDGLPLVYSTSLVGRDLLVLREPADDEPQQRLEALLAPHGLELRPVEGMLLVVRAEAATVATHGDLLVLVRQDSGAPIAGPVILDAGTLPAVESHGVGLLHFTQVPDGTHDFLVTAAGFHEQRQAIEVEAGGTSVLVVRMAPAPVELSPLVVSSSRYALERDATMAPAILDRRAIESTPDLGNDPLRAVQRLPGVGAGGLSAQSHMRGGKRDEVGVYLNGHQLLDPFHVRDYQNIFSVIDVRAIASMEVYTGGFPSRYGNRTSGLVLIDADNPAAPGRTELGFSTYNASILTAGTGPDGEWDWLVSARYSTLDEFINARLGSPSYYDGFLQLGFSPDAGTRVLVSALVADDRVDITLENDGEEQERSSSDTRNRQFWLSVVQDWTPALHSTTVVSHVSLDNERLGILAGPDEIDGRVVDRRDVTLSGVRSDWRLSIDHHTLMVGIEYRDEAASYDYTSDVRYLEETPIFEGRPASVSRRTVSRRRGSSFSLYLADRWRVSERWTLEAGVRWDRQTYTRTEDDSQISPRLAARRLLGEDAELRLSWGRFSQPQGIGELQVEDGVDSFGSAEEVDHWIASYRRRLSPTMTLRTEAYYKVLRQLRPRFENLFDPLELIPELQPDRIRLDPTSGRAYGVEVSLAHAPGESFSWWASYALSDVDERIDGRTEPRSWDQRHAIQAGVAWTPGAWELTLAGSWHSGWPTTDLALVRAGNAEDDHGAPFVLDPGPRNAASLGSFASIDLRISRRFKVGEGKLVGFFELTNALDRENPCCVDYESDDGQLLRSEDNWLPIVPALGISWEF